MDRKWIGCRGHRASTWILPASFRSPLDITSESQTMFGDVANLPFPNYIVTVEFNNYIEIVSYSELDSVDS